MEIINEDLANVRRELNESGKNLIAAQEKLLDGESKADRAFYIVREKNLIERERNLIDREKNLLQRKKNFLLSKESPSDVYNIQDIAFKIESMKPIEAFRAALYVSPFETVTLFSGLFLGTTFLYLKAFCPFRHRYVPYDESQLAFRNSIGARLSHPSTRRTFVILAVSSWVFDKIRHYNK